MLAVAIKAPACAIITFNRKHFPTRALGPLSIVAHDPGDYLCTLYDMDPGVVTARLYESAIKYGQEPIEAVRRLRGPLPRFARYFADSQGWALYLSQGGAGLRRPCMDSPQRAGSIRGDSNGSRHRR